MNISTTITTKDYLIDETAIYKYIIGWNIITIVLTQIFGNNIETTLYYSFSGLGLLTVMLLGIFGYASKITLNTPFNMTLKYKIQVLLAIITTVPSYILITGTRFNDIIASVLMATLILTIFLQIPRKTSSHN
jgi:hypothetical protein